MNLGNLLVIAAACAVLVISAASSAGASTNPTDRASRASQVAAAKPKVEIYVTEWCPYCRRLEGFLKANGVAYKRYDIEKDGKDARRRYVELGGGGVPIIKVGSTVMRGLDEGALRRELKLK